MTTTLFQEWLGCFNICLKKQKKKLCLLLDHCLANKIEDNLKCIELVYFPPNTTFPVQPLD